jgi:hypothetical protein
MTGDGFHFSQGRVELVGFHTFDLVGLFLLPPEIGSDRFDVRISAKVDCGFEAKLNEAVGNKFFSAIEARGVSWRASMPFVKLRRIRYSELTDEFTLEGRVMRGITGSYGEIMKEPAQ